MSFQVEDRLEQIKQALRSPTVQDAMRFRCEETSHDWENGLTVMFQVIQVCKWCQSRRTR